MADAGVRWIQIRAKSLPDRLRQREIERLLETLDPLEVDLWINDRTDLAALYPFSGLHLGLDDLPIDAARRVVGKRMWIGASTHSLEQIESAADDPAVDGVAVGPVFPTRSKEGSGPAVGLDLVRAARARTEKPVIGIGGIDVERTASVLEAGADSVAVLGALCRGSLEANLRHWEPLL
jgi:thiamine-phosphate pyrophosphorylase